MDNRVIIQNLATVRNALDQIEVRGKQNLINLSGSIDIIEAIITNLQKEAKEKTSQEME